MGLILLAFQVICFGPFRYFLDNRIYNHEWPVLPSLVFYQKIMEIVSSLQYLPHAVTKPATLPNDPQNQATTSERHQKQKPFREPKRCPTKPTKLQLTVPLSAQASSQMSPAFTPPTRVPTQMPNHSMWCRNPGCLGEDNRGTLRCFQCFGVFMVF